jgi:threonine/homoserine/homoserine lactone efflux protein
MHETARVVVYGLLATASPITLLATLVVLGSGRGRANGAAFASAFVGGQVIAFLIAFFVGSALSEGGHHTAAAYLEVGAGAVLLVIAARTRPPHQPGRDDRSPRTEELFRRLSRLTPKLAVSIGFALGIGAKRLALTILAATTVALDGLSPPENAGLAALYVVVSTLVVSIPVTLYVILGARSDDLMARSRRWITENEELLTFVSALVLGVLIVLDGIVHLLV